MKYRIRHITHYDYDQVVNACYNRAHLLPRETAFQSTSVPQVIIFPIPSTGSRRVDYFGNREYHFAIHEPHKELSIEVITDVNLSGTRIDPVGQLQYGNTCQQVKELLNSQYLDVETLYAREFLLDSPMIKSTDNLLAYAEECFSDSKPLLSAVRDLTNKIYTTFEYDPSFTTIMTPLDEVLKYKRGVCQDFAHLAIGCLRALGYPARYISGYLETLPPPGEKKLVGVDASHAWFSVYSPGEGWFEFDPTNDTIPVGQHIVTAWGRDYSDVSPLRGVILGGGVSQSLSVSVDVARLTES
ncbi:transglutaminase [Candidatus Endobugula sertula]|uniref:Transglutaminase n=1 Tax=Candidatus Endobugula sertula TaxID=62101 RepID=A0A1D2QQC6_9GAMM|nr:transglutaminase [Candidatus Endobugula sertula]